MVRNVLKYSAVYLRMFSNVKWRREDTSYFLSREEPLNGKGERYLRRGGELEPIIPMVWKKAVIHSSGKILSFHCEP